MKELTNCKENIQRSLDYDKKIVIFDLDDTLQPTSHLYDKVKEKVKVKMMNIFKDKINPDEIIPTIEKIDIQNVEKLGFKRTRFPLSIVEAYMYFCKKVQNVPDINDIRELYELADSIYDVVEPLYNKAYETIKKIKEMGYIIYILTAGDEVVQFYKIYKNKLYTIVDENNIIVTPYKTKDVYEKLFKKYGFENCVMIGNSIRSDINPALAVGMSAIYIPSETTWAYDNVKLQFNQRFYKARKIEDVPDILKKIFA